MAASDTHKWIKTLILKFWTLKHGIQSHQMETTELRSVSHQLCPFSKESNLYTCVNKSFALEYSPYGMENKNIAHSVISLECIEFS